MSAQREFDIGPLTWVKSEIDQALSRARQSIDQVAAGDAAQLKFCQTYLHQVTGAVLMVGLDGVARFSEEAEKLLSMLENEPGKRAPALLELIRRALNALAQYLDGLLEGEPDVPLNLFPLFKELAQAGGAENISESELFFPDLNPRPPKHPQASAIAEADIGNFAKKQRGEFQRGLLDWLRNPDDPQGVKRMYEALSAIEQAQPQPAQRTFWWAAGGFIEALMHKGAEADFHAKQLCAHIDLQIRRLSAGSYKIAERQFREVLRFVARCPALTNRIREIKELYALDSLLPKATGLMPGLMEYDTSKLVPLMRDFRETLAGAKDAWAKYTSGAPDALPRFREQVTKLIKLVCELGVQPLQKLLEVIKVAIARAPAKGEENEALALEMATALLLAENASENYANPATELPRQVEVMASRLLATLGEKSQGGELPDVPLLDEITRKAQEKLLIAQVVNEIQTNMSHIEQVLDSFFRDVSKRGQLSSLVPFLKQVLGALNILGLDQAAKLLIECQTLVQKLGTADYTAPTQELELLADGLSSLGFYIHAVENNQPDREQIIAPVLRKFQGEPEPVTAPAIEETAAPEAAPLITVEATLELQKREAQNLFAAWQEKPEDPATREKLAQNLEVIRQDADLARDKHLQQQAASALELLKSDAQAEDAKLTETMLTLTSTRVRLEAPSEQTQRMLAASKEVVDEELLQIFLEEAQEVLSTINEHLGVVTGEPHNIESLTTIRRSFHTLKGSGRMVGLKDLGEVAWSIEQVMNKWLQEEKSATPPLLDLVKLAHAAFSSWVSTLQAQGWAEIKAPNMTALADALLHGKDTSAPGPEAAPAHARLAEVIELAAAPAFEAAAKPAEESIVIGMARIDPALYRTYLDEAAGHIATLNYECAQLKQNAEQNPSEALMRSAHTLAGISRTAGLTDIAELGSALEQWALELLEHPASMSETELHTTVQAVSKLEQMIDAVRERRAPEPADKEIQELQLLLSAAITQTQPMISKWSEQPEPAAVSPASNAEQFPPQPAVPEFEIPIPDFITKAASEAETVEPAAPVAEIKPRPDAVPAAVISPAAAAPVPAKAQAAEELGLTRERRVIRDDLDPQLLPVFLDEAHDLVPIIGEDLRSWRTDPKDEKSPMILARALHTLKGSARMAGAMRLGELTHNMESKVENAAQLGRPMMSLFDDLENQLDRMVAEIEKVKRGTQPEAVSAAEASAAEAVATRVAAEPEQIQVQAMLRVRADVVDRLVNEAGEVSIARARIEGEMHAFKQSLLELTESVARLRNQLREVEIQAETQMQSRMSKLGEEAQRFDPLEFDRFSRLQELTRLMAESVHDVSTVQQTMLKNLDDADAAISQQARLNRDLQDELMRVRTVPFSSIVERLYRIVRLTAKELGKKANLEIRGSQVELDRSVLEKISAPVEHMLRNSITHGIEDPGTRVTHGKFETGEINITLRQEANEIVIALSDDGGGLNFERIRQKGLEAGLLKPDEQPTEARLAQLIFESGFSTAQEITELAGRGVGMDVVKAEITGLGGRVEVTSRHNEGTTFTLHLPLTLVVAQAVLVRAAGRVYALPSTMVEQVQEPRAEELATLQQNHERVWLGNSYPFHYLPRLLGDKETLAETKRYNPVLLLRSGLQRVAVHVDEIIRSQEVVVKNIGVQLARAPGVVGATVLGSGQVVLILNPVLLAARLATFPAEAPPLVTPAPIKEERAAPLVLVVDDSLTVRKITGRLLTREGYQVATAKDGVDALQQLQDLVPDAMVVDIEMPRMDGFDLTKNVRADPRIAGIPIIMISSRSVDKHRNLALQLGVNVFLGKPYQEDELLKHIAGYVKQAV